MLGWLWSMMVSSSQCGWLWWKIREKDNGCTWTYPVCFLKDTPKRLVIQAVRYGSLKFRGKVKAGNRYMSVSFCPLRLYKSSLICFSHGGPPNTWGQPWHSLTPPHWAAWRLNSLGSSRHCSLGGSQAKWLKASLLKVWSVDQQHHLGAVRNAGSQTRLRSTKAESALYQHSAPTLSHCDSCSTLV